MRKKTSKTYYYQKASGLRRIATRFLDLIFVGFILLIFNLLLNVKNIKNWTRFAQNGSTLEIARVKQLLPLAAVFIVPIFYFVVIAYLNNCQTIGKKISAIRVVDHKSLKKPSLRQFIKHELFISILPSFCSLLFLVFVACISNSSWHYLFLGNSGLNHISGLQRGVLTVIQSLYGVANIIILFLALFLVLSKKKTGLHDLVSQTWTIRNKKYLLPKNKSSHQESINSNPLEIFHRPG